MTYGLTPTGFISKTSTEIQSDIGTNMLVNLDAALDLSPDQPFGQVIGIFSNELAPVWDLLATVYNQMNPDAAEGDLLRSLCALTGVRAQSATKSHVTCVMNLAAGTSVPAGSIAYVQNQPANTWTLVTTVTNATLDPADFNGEFQSSLAGPYVANANTLIVIGTPVIGWNSIYNPEDATLGLSEDTDAQLRLKRQAELSASGAANPDAIRADVLQVPGVLQAFCYENTSLLPDIEGVPGKAFHVIIWDGPGSEADNDAVAQAIWNSHPSGIQSFGGIFGNATDSTGTNQVMYFDRATEVPVYMTLTTTRNASASSDYRTEVRAALVAYANLTLNLGVDVVALAFRAQALTVTGVLDVPTFTLGITPAPLTTSNIVISSLQIATLSTTDILVDGL